MLDSPNPRSRRLFLADVGTAAIGFAVLGIAACSSSDADSTTRPSPTTSAASVTTAPSTTAPPVTSATTEAPATSRSPADAAWQRIVLGTVSAYVVVRRAEAAIIDTGNGGSLSAIETVLGGLGVGWDDVGHVIITHDHGDHQGGLTEVMTAAADATAYAGALDIPDMISPREIVAVGDGDSVIGLDVIETPGHTPGHISLLDPELSVLFSGDAMVGDGGVIGGPVPRFTADLAAASLSVAKLATLPFDTAVFGHGEPVAGEASRLARELAATL